MLWRRHNGFKHVWDVDGWPFVGQPLFNDYILTTAASTVILLYRKNLLQRIVSDEMSHQSKLWHVKRTEDRAKLVEHAFKALDRAAIRTRLVSEHQAFTDVQKRLDEARVQYKIVSYEDLFMGSEAQNLSTLAELIVLITKQRYRPKNLDRRALNIMDPALRRLNSSETYRLVPKIHEIDDEFGCKETGFLFST